MIFFRYLFIKEPAAFQGLCFSAIGGHNVGGKNSPFQVLHCDVTIRLCVQSTGEECKNIV